MSANSKIEWTDHTANFWWGCVKVSPGCEHCYAETLVKRWGGDNIWGPPKTTSREFKAGVWRELPRWNRKAQAEGKRRRVFVQSMSDFFEDHPDVGEWRSRALGMMEALGGLDFQVLTKRPENVRGMLSPRYFEEGGWPENIWIGVSVEDQKRADERIPLLLEFPAPVRFLSCEPLLGPLDLWAFSGAHGSFGSSWDHRGTYGYYQIATGRIGSLLEIPGIDWVIAGGESGPGKRPMDLAWARSLRDQCHDAGVAFFMKQIDKVQPIPADLMIREFPALTNA